ncbi:MAG TPA: cell division protein FtsL [Burkholderiales bacterium]
MPRHAAMLASAVLVVAMLVVALRHESRLLFAQLQTLRSERDALNTEWGQLLLEEGTWSEHRRIEQMARTRLDMHIPGRDRIIVLDGTRPAP